MKVLVAILSLAVVALLLGLYLRVEGAPPSRDRVRRDFPPLPTLPIDAKEPKLVKTRNVTIKAPDDAIVIEFVYKKLDHVHSLYLHDDWMIHWRGFHDESTALEVFEIYYKGEQLKDLATSELNLK